MTIETHKPELEALIQERVKTGVLQTVEDVLKRHRVVTELSRPNAVKPGLR
jgi:hypothetical protein